MVISLALTCLALNTYYEARGEPILGQYAVAMVVLNRAHHDASKVCEVVAKPNQFSWTQKLAENSTKLILKDGVFPEDMKAWVQSIKVAYDVLHEETVDITGGSRFYHSKKIKPKWSKKMTGKFVIGKHVFYMQERGNA